MTILFTNSLGKLKWGGGEKWMIMAANGLSARGHRCLVACRKGSVIEQKAQADGIETVPFHFSTDIDFHKLPAFKRILREQRVQVLVCCQNKDVKLGARVGRSIGVPAIFARQGIQNLSDKRRYIKPFTKYIDGIITNTHSIRRIYEAFRWMPRNFVHVVHNGVHMPQEVKALNLREKYSFPKSAVVIVSAGRLEDQKGFDLLVEVGVMAKKLGHDWRIVVAGKGKLHGHLQQMAAQAGLNDRFILAGFQEDMPGFVSGSDVFVLPSRYEGMPNAALEAMALGRACVVTRVNGAEELIEDGVSGMLVPPDDAEALFDALSTIIADNEARKRMEEAAMRRVSEHFSIRAMIDQLEEIFGRQLAAFRTAAKK